MNTPSSSFLRFATWPLHVSRLAKSGRAEGIPRSAEQIIGEALRVPECSPHISSVQEAWVIRGKAAAAVDRLHAAIDRAKKDGVRLRRDTPILLTIVASWPIPTEQVVDSADEMAPLIDWMQQVDRYFVRWAQTRAATLDLTLLHLDEPYPHLHLHLFASGNGMRADAIHPGKSAQSLVRKAAQEGSLSGPLKSECRKAYKAAMRAELHAYWEACTRRHGMSLKSDAPRKRLSRADYMRLKAMRPSKQPSPPVRPILPLEPQTRTACVGDLEGWDDSPAPRPEF
jgi:hypothetical protein